jgi:predicted ATP-grasp superfamily ATP-dependent carboligase
MNNQRSSAAGGKVLVLGTDARVVLAICRSLGRQGISVHLGWLDPDSIACHSRYVQQIHRIAPYHPAELTWKHELLELIDKEDFQLIIPCNDSTVVPLQLHAADFAHVQALHLHRPEVYDVVFNKLKTVELAKKLGVHVARTAVVHSPADHEAAQRLQLPVVVKPLTTFDGSSGMNKSHVVVCASTSDELTAILARAPYASGCIVQEYFSGTGMGVEILADQGTVLTSFQHERLHETMAYGSSYRKSVALHPELHAAACSLMQALGYTGVGMVEFLMNKETGQWILVEINGRFWGSLPLAIHAGADFPYFLYQYWVEQRRSFPASYRLDVYCRNLLLDWQGRKQRKSTGRSRLRDFWRDIRNLATCRDHLDSFSIDDPRPAVME